MASELGALAAPRALGLRNRTQAGNLGFRFGFKGLSKQGLGSNGFWTGLRCQRQSSPLASGAGGCKGEPGILGNDRGCS